MGMVVIYLIPPAAVISGMMMDGEYLMAMGGVAWGFMVAAYAPSLFETGLAIGGVAFAAIIVVIGLRVLRFLPDSLADADLDPHHRRRTSEASA